MSVTLVIMVTFRGVRILSLENRRYLSNYGNFSDMTLKIYYDTLKYGSNGGNLGNYGNLPRSRNFKLGKIVVI